MARRGGMYSATKRKKELKRQKKQEEKRQKRLNLKNSSEESEDTGPINAESESAENIIEVTDQEKAE